MNLFVSMQIEKKKWQSVYERVLGDGEKVKNIDFLLDRMAMLTGVAIYRCQEERIKAYKKNVGYNPIAEKTEFRRQLMMLADGQELPLIYQDSHQVLFFCIRSGKIYYIFGPVSLKEMDKIELHKYYRDYGMREGMEKRLLTYSFSRALSLMETFAELLLHRQYGDEELIRANRLTKQLDENMEKEQILFSIEEEDAGFYHHTYREERALLDCVREGRVEDTLQYNMRIDLETGVMSKNVMNHWKNVLVVAVTLCTRAAIEGGLSPAEAYQLSDYYIQKSDECRDVASVIVCRNRAVRELTERVQKKKQGHRILNYIESCKDYINRHYKEKIYLDEIAERLGITGTYLSRLFAQETGERLQDYIVKLRVEHAANLLIYSEETLARIAEYVNFPSQSYMGSMFKKYKNTTPKEYRDRYKPKEFEESKTEI